MTEDSELFIQLSKILLGIVVGSTIIILLAVIAHRVGVQNELLRQNNGKTTTILHS